MLGKEKCRILKQIRQRIADENDIPYVTRECGFQGECRGTCPRCESELRYLERQLALRASLGKRVAVAAICASVGLGTAACSPFAPEIEPDLMGETTCYVEPTEPPGIGTETGEVAWPEENDGDALPSAAERGEIAVTELTGDIAYVPENGNG